MITLDNCGNDIMPTACTQKNKFTKRNKNILFVSAVSLLLLTLVIVLIVFGFQNLLCKFGIQ